MTDAKRIETLPATPAMAGQRRDATPRLAVIGLALALLFTLACHAAFAKNPPEAPQEPVSLIAEATVDGDMIRLGDVFRNAGQYADRRIAKAPSPGNSLSLEARWLGRVAQAFGLDWRPTSKFDTALVTRRSQTIDSDTLRREIGQAVLERLNHSQRTAVGMDELLDISLDNQILSLNLPMDVAPTVGIHQIEIDPRSDRFSAVVVAPRTPPHDKRVAVSGQIHRLVPAPVPTRRIMRGEVIEPQDIDTVLVRRRMVSTNIVLDPAQLIGQSARQTLSQGRLVASNAVEPQVMVKKGGLVTVTLKSGAMTLTARAKAMENGSLDEVIQVMNMQSRRVFEATVTGPGNAEVLPLSQVALQ